MKKLLMVLGCLSLTAGLVFGAAVSVEQDSASITPDAETTKTYAYVKKIEIYNASMDVRIAFNAVTTADGQDYWIVPNSAIGFEATDLNLEKITVRLKGDGSDDSGTVRIIVYH